MMSNQNQTSKHMHVSDETGGVIRIAFAFGPALELAPPPWSARLLFEDTLLLLILGGMSAISMLLEAGTV